jgi:DNA-binding HxlR family transcriptional regulator
VAIQKRLDVGRGSLQRTLAALVDAGLMRRNAGYGHPLRPEYMLTDAGKKAALAAAPLMSRMDELGISELTLKKWSLPVAQALFTTDGRFNKLLGVLPDVTSRALAQALKDLEAATLVERELVDGRPPHTEYRLTAEGRRLVKLTRALGQSS